MSYKIKRGSVIVAIQQDGRVVAKTATKEKLYSEAERNDEGGWYSFKVKPGGLYSEFRVMLHDVEVAPDITAVADGTYTVIFPEYGGYITIKLCTSKHPTNEDGTKNFFFGKQIVSYLSGPDNENNFRALPILMRLAACVSGSGSALRTWPGINWRLPRSRRLAVRAEAKPDWNTPCVPVVA